MSAVYPADYNQGEGVLLMLLMHIQGASEHEMTPGQQLAEVQIWKESESTESRGVGLVPVGPAWVHTPQITHQDCFVRSSRHVAFSLRSDSNLLTSFSVSHLRTGETAASSHVELVARLLEAVHFHLTDAWWNSGML
ncbi:hypothetical protein J4Q44_G00204740 [Coregonus suidteri]|uniref:Uncharacterized protein n=1 Tax=Coregonus suidteri TaxID=861788 RepID=A0AAN8LRS3_9TELE